MPDDDVVAFDLQRFSQLPDRLGRIAGELEDAAERFCRSEEPAGTRAAMAIDELVGWVRREQARAAERWARIMAIPGFAVFDTWDRGERRWEWDLGWIAGVDATMFSYAQLEAIAAYHHVLRPVLLDVERGEPVGRGAVDDALAVLAAAGDDPALAASLLNLVGAEGYRRLHAALAATAGPEPDGDDVARLEEGAATLTAAFAAASHATGRHRLHAAFVDGLICDGDPIDADVSPSPSAVDEAQEVLTRLDFSRELAERLASAAGPRGALVVLQRAGTPFAILNLAMPLAELLQHGPLSAEFAGSTITTSLGVAALLAEGAAASVVLLGAAALVALIFATAGDGGTPPGLVLSPDATNPGGSHYPQHVNEAGVPASPNGV